VNLVLVDHVLPVTIPVVIVNRHSRLIDGELLKVGTSVTVDLCVEVREDAALEQRVFAKVDTADNVPRLEHDLLSLGKIVGRVRVQLHHTKCLERCVFLRNDLGRIQDIEAIGKGFLLINNLNCEFPLGTVSRSDSVPQVLSVCIQVLSRQGLGLLPDQRGPALFGLPVELDQLGGSVIRDKTVRVNAETILFRISVMC
jgi:hypothetical protein